MLCLFLGATYLTLKTVGELRERLAKLSGRLGWLAAAVVLGWVTWSHLGLNEGFVPKPVDALALAGRGGAALWLAEARSEGAAFAAGAVAIGSVVASIFFDLFPQVMVSSTNSLYSLTVAGSASPAYTLKVMTVVAVLFTPVVLAYQAWSLWIFRKRLGAPPVSADPMIADHAPRPTRRQPSRCRLRLPRPRPNPESMSTTTKEIP